MNSCCYGVVGRCCWRLFLLVKLISWSLNTSAIHAFHPTPIYPASTIKLGTHRSNSYSFPLRTKRRVTSFTELSSSSSSSSSSTNTSPSSTPSIKSILNASLLISGTTIGGGFLALPTITSTIGFVPSSITLVGVWLYFLFQSFILVECIEYTKKEGENEKNKNEDLESNASTSNISNGPGVSTAARNTLGISGEVIIGLLLIILIEATLVSQISRAGSMVTMMMNTGIGGYSLGCAISSISIAMLVFAPKRRGVQFASEMNSFLTIGFLLSTLGVFSCGIPYANWDRLGLSGAAATATAASSAASIPVGLGSVSNAIPTFLQLLVYGEILPTVCFILNYNTKATRLAIFMGSLLTLCIQIGWSGLGISLMLPQSISSAGAMATDAVGVLMAQGGIVQFPLLCLSVTAILTTILGSYLALLSMFNDIYSKLLSKKGTGNNSNDTDPGKNNLSATNASPSTPLEQRFIVGSMITLPALLIASTSPSLFLKAIDFAGSYPVLLLWGVMPGVMTLIQRYRQRNGVISKRIHVNSSGPSSWLVFLISVSISMVGMSAKSDLTSIFSKLFSTT